MISQFLDIKFSFFCRSSITNKAGQNPIVLRIMYRGERIDVFTGLHCSFSDWDNAAQRLTNKAAGGVTNGNLDDILFRCRDVFNEMKYSGCQFTLQEFVCRIKGDEKPPETMVAYLANKVVELKGRVAIDITAATLQKYNRCIKHMKEFLKSKFKHDDIAITSIDNSFLMDFFYFLRSTKNNSHNTSVNYIKCLKTVLMPAIKSGVLLRDPFYGLKLAPKVVMRGYLTTEEIQKIEDLDDLSEGAKQARDLFLFACYTGMAYIDVKQFSRKHLIKETDGSYCIRKPRQKTGIISIIPLLPPAQRILESFSPTGEPLDFAWKVISNQKINDHLKAIALKAQISQNLFFHLARHTFATTITLSNGVPLESVSKMLGHADIKMTQRYAKISGYKVKEDMRRLMYLFK